MTPCKAILTLLFFMMAVMPLAAQTKAPPKNKFYSLYDDGGEHAAEVCELTSFMPSKLTQSLKGYSGYLGSEQIEFADKNEASIDAYQHYFKNAKDCKKAIQHLGYN